LWGKKKKKQLFCLSNLLRGGMGWKMRGLCLQRGVITHFRVHNKESPLSLQPRGKKKREVIRPLALAVGNENCHLGPWKKGER